MATYSAVKAAHKTLSGATVDTVQLTQPWDLVEVANQSGTSIYLTVNGATPTIAGDDTEIVEPGSTKLFPITVLGGAVIGSTTSPCHQVKIIGAGNAYDVIGTVAR